MVNVTDAQFKAAEARGRRMLETEPRASAAHYDQVTGRVVVDLINGCSYAFPAELVQDLHGASPAALAGVEVDALAGAGCRPLRSGTGVGNLRHAHLDDSGACPCGRSGDIASKGRCRTVEWCKRRASS